jgi:hypothetical protein
VILGRPRGGIPGVRPRVGSLGEFVEGGLVCAGCGAQLGWCGWVRVGEPGAQEMIVDAGEQ